MKTINLLKIIVITLLFNSCCNQDDGNPVENSLKGKWYVVEIIGGFTGTNATFQEGVISWGFNSAENTLHIVNYSNDDSVESLFETGTYTYGVQTNTATPELCEETIILDNIDFGCFKIENDELIISQIESDGYYIKLIRY